MLYAMCMHLVYNYDAYMCVYLMYETSFGHVHILPLRVTATKRRLQNTHKHTPA